MSTFPITIDATPLNLCHKHLLLWANGEAQGEWFDTEVAKTFQLQSGSCKFQIGSASFAAFTFDVTPEGLVEYDPSFDNFIEGRGTSALTLKGLKVTLDARYISSTVTYLIEIYMRSDHITNTTWNMLPCDDYSVIVGSSQRANFNFSLKGNGHFAYDPAYECKPDGSGGFLRGAGTSKIEFLGYPFLVDARAADEGAGFLQLGLGLSPSAVQFANLLPASGYQIWYKSSVEPAAFDLGHNGKISLPKKIKPPIIQVKKFHNLALLVIAPQQP